MKIFPPFSPANCFPDTGGDFVYLKKLVPNKTLGDIFAFLRIFVELLVIRPGSHAAIALTVSKYIIVPFTGGLVETAVSNSTNVSLADPSLGEYWTEQYCFDVVKQEKSEKDVSIIALEVAVAIVLTVALTLVNAYSMSFTKLLGDVLSVLKVLVLLALVMLGVITIAQGNFSGLAWSTAENGLWDNTTWSTSTDSSLTTGTIIGRLVMASYAGQWSYAGWSDVNYAMEEIVNPSRNYPIAAAISMISVTLLYTAIVTGFYSVLTHKDIVCGIDATTTLFVEKALGYQNPNLTIRIAIAIAVSLSTAGALHGSFFATSRLFFSGSRQNHLPPIFGGLHKVHKTPIPSLLILCLLSCLYCLLPFFHSGAISFLINSTCFVYFLAIAACVLLLIIWRIKGRPNAGSVLDKIDMGNTDRKDFDNTRVLLNETQAGQSGGLNETRFYQEMTLDEVFIMPLIWHILYATISFFITIYAIIVDPITCGYGFIFIALGLPVYFFFIHNKSDLTKKGKIIPKQGGALTKSLLKFLNCKMESHGLVKDDGKGFDEPSTDELLAKKDNYDEQQMAEVYDM